MPIPPSSTPWRCRAGRSSRIPMAARPTRRHGPAFDTHDRHSSPGVTRVFFASSGAEANDASIKLARKVTGRMDVISTHQSFHGRTISTASATGQAKHRDKFNPLMPNYRFVAYNSTAEIGEALDDRVAAVVLEPIQARAAWSSRRRLPESRLRPVRSEQDPVDH